MACLVTGGTGFIGSYVVRDLLSQGKEVVCLQRSGVTPVSRFVIGEDNLDKVKVVQGDVSDTLQLFQVIQEHAVDLIVHVSYVMNDVSEIRPAYALRVNCIGMNNVLEAARLFGLRRVVWTSSGQVFGPISKYYQGVMGDDDALYMPDTMYGATKVLGEFMSRLYFDKFGVDSICLRMGLTLGIGKSHGKGGVFTKFLRDMATDAPATMAVVDAAFATSGLMLHATHDVRLPDDTHKARVYVLTSPAYADAAKDEVPNTVSAQVLRIAVYTSGDEQKTWINMANPVAHAMVYYANSPNYDALLGAAGMGDSALPRPVLDRPA